MRIFINNFDSYVGRALCADLRGALGQENKLFGTLTRDDAPEAEGELMFTMGIKRIVSREDREKYLADVMSCSLIVYDLHDANIEDVEMVIKHLKIAELNHETTFVLISSVNVWARTDPGNVPVDTEEGEEAGEENDEDGEGAQGKKLRPKELTDADLDRRIPSPAYEPWKYLETLVLALNSKAKLRPHVVCSGILYGNGETTFNCLFKMAWLTQPEHEIILPGTNYIPCVHVRDVARLVKTLHIRDPSSPLPDRYLVAVDRAWLTQEQIVRGIIGQMSKKRDVPMAAPEDVQNPAFKEIQDIMSLNLIMQASAPMRSSSFPWWCRDGLAKNLDKVAAEFCKWRNLRPIKIIAMGPPGAGAERLCNLIAVRYLHEDPPHLTYEGIVQDACNAPGRAARKLRAKVQKRDAARSRGEVAAKLSLALRTGLVRKRLLTNVCRYRGYVLEGYPETYAEAEALFMEKIPDPDAEGGEEEAAADDEEAEGGEGEEEAEEEEEEPPVEEGAGEEEQDDDAEPTTRLDQAIAPEFVVKLSSAPDACKARIFSGAAKGPDSEERFLFKTAEYQQMNNPQDGSPGTSDFFSEVAGVRVLHLDMDTSTEGEAFQSTRIYMESKGQYFNYLESEEERCQKQAALLAQAEQVEDEQRELMRQELEAAEAELRAQAAEDEAGRRQVIADGEASLLEAEATPLRQYLQLNVVPTLSEGLSEVCKEQPEDPIEFLAQYLFAHAQDISDNLDSAQ